MKGTGLASILLLGIVLMSGIACGKGGGVSPTPTPSATPTIIATPTPRDITDLVITLKRAYRVEEELIYTLQIYGANRTTIGSRDGKKTCQGYMTHNEILELVDEFYRIDFFSLDDEYNIEGYRPLQGTLLYVITSIYINGSYKSVLDISGAPKELRKLEEKIQGYAPLVMTE